jgi:hypothetical protein
MKKLLLFLGGLCVMFSVYAQNEGFKIHPNGFLYSQNAIDSLRLKASSLDASFNETEFKKTFYSFHQTMGHLVNLDSGDVKSAISDFENGISFDQFFLKYPHAKIDRDAFIIRTKNKNYNDVEVVEIQKVMLKPNDYFHFYHESENLSLYQWKSKSKWLYNYEEETSYSPESVKAIFFLDDFQTTPIPHEYALKIGYADHLIDTTTVIYGKNMTDGFSESLPENWHKFSKRKQSKLLDQLRNTRVVGSCSFDSGPRQHAVNIAVLAAETVEWEVFLKAHLDIMNDRVERVADNNYASKGRDSYVKELEELNIDLLKLVFGITLRVENPASNHYFGDLSRIGRALAESIHRTEFENTILALIEDKTLDDYNRILFYVLFENYIYFLEDEDEKEKNSLLLQKSLKTFPYSIGDILAKRGESS